MNRRQFVTVVALGAGAAAAADGPELGQWKTAGNLRQEDGPATLEAARWFVA